MSQTHEKQILNQAPITEFNLPVNIRIENWTNKDIVLDALNIIHNKTDIAIDVSKILVVEKLADSCLENNDKCEKTFIIYMPSIRIWLKYEKNGNYDYAEAKIYSEGE
jgi:hypothetical protein